MFGLHFHLSFTYILFFLSVLCAGGIFYLFTTEIFAVEFGSGIWWTALIIELTFCYFLAVVVTRNHYSFWFKALLLVIGIGLVSSTVILGLRYRPFDPKNIKFKLGADPMDPYGLSDINFDDLPPPKSEVSWEKFLPEPVDQGSCGSCWATASAGAMSARINIKEGKPEKKKYTCRKNENVSSWHISPQALIDLDTWRNNKTKGKCNASYFTQGYHLLETVGAVSSSCVPLFSADEPNCKIDCGSPKIRANRTGLGETTMCIKDENKFEWTKCTENGASPTKTRISSAYRIKGEETLKREISQNGPVLCSLNFYRKKNGSLPIWTLTGISRSTGENTAKYISPGFVARPEMDKEEYTKEFSAGGHAVVVYGYGISGTGVPYWDIMNSWGSRWGIDGKSKIERGIDAWNIESLCVGGKL